MKTNIILALCSLLFCILFIFLFEALTRFLYPEINHQDTQYSLIRENAFGTTAGLKANASGISFGAMITTDEFGYRKINSPEKYDLSWLILGDSVTLGVGVEAEDTFVALMQKERPTIKLWNTAVMSYSLKNYRDVLFYFPIEKENVSRAILFYCINDVLGGLNLQPSYSNVFSRFISFLRRESKLYLFLKNAFFDRSKSYCLREIRSYDVNSEELRDGLEVIDEMHAYLMEKKIDLTVVILPYEYQLRMRDDQYLIPQKNLSGFFHERGISYLDAYEPFQSLGGNTKRFYLYADGMHFSKEGHRIIYEMLRNRL